MVRFDVRHIVASLLVKLRAARTMFEHRRPAQHASPAQKAAPRDRTPRYPRSFVDLGLKLAQRSALYCLWYNTPLGDRPSSTTPAWRPELVRASWV